MNDQTKRNLARSLLSELQNAGKPALSSPASASHPRSAATAPPAVVLPEICYDNATTYYWMRSRRGRFIKISKSDAEAHLCAAGLNPYSAKGEPLSEVDLAILRIQQEHDVDYVGALSGRTKGLFTFGDTRFLVTSEPTFLTPAPGDCSMLLGILERMFGPLQMPYLLGWISVALDMFRRCTWRPGQALFVAGPPGAGKGLLGSILRHLFGGRAPGKPYRFMTGRVEFNSDFFGSELLTIEDEVESTSIQARRAFGAAIKIMTVNEFQWLHAKGKPALSAIPLWRIYGSFNDDLERMQVMPPIEDDIADKIILLLARKHPLPMPTETAEQFEAFMVALISQLPAFLHYLDQWTMPDSIRSSRFGVSHYQHPELLNSIQQLSPEESLLALIDEFVFTPVNLGKPWQGRSSQLDRLLKGHEDRRCAREAEKLLTHHTSCGKYLGRLARIHPSRVSQGLRSGNAEWKILAPDPNASSSIVQSFSADLMDKIRATKPERRSAEPAA